MTDAEILEALSAYFQTKVNNLSGDEMAEGPFEDGTEDGELWEQAASRIDARGGLRVRFEFADADPALTAAVDQREQRAVAEAWPHDDEPAWDDMPLLDRAAGLLTTLSTGWEGEPPEGVAEAEQWLREYREQHVAGCAVCNPEVDRG